MTEPEAATSPRARLERALPLLLVVAALAALIAPALDPSVQLYYRDTGRLFYPVKKFIATELHEGHLPLWDPWTESGTSLLAQVTPGLLHPFTLLYLVLPFDLAFKLNHLLPLPLAGLGAYLLARRLHCSRWAAAAAGVTYGGCGYVVSMAACNLPYAVGSSTVPLALASFLAYAEKPTAGRLLASAAALALAAYAGDPQSMLFAGVIGSAWVVTRAVAAGPPAARLRSRLARGSSAGLRAASWGVLALALSAPVAFPAAARLPETRGHGVNQKERSAFLVSPRRLPGYLIPGAFDDRAEALEHGGVSQGLNPFPEFFGYDTYVAFSDSILIGAPALLLALLGCLSGRKGRFLFAGGGFFALASTGPSLGIQELAMALVPGFRYFRYAEKFAGPTSLLFALAAGVGLDFALRGTKTAARALLALSAGLAAAAGLASLLLGRYADAAASLAAAEGVTHNPILAARLIESLRGGLLVLAGLTVALGATALLRRGRLSDAPAALAFCCCAAAVLACNTGSLLTAPVELMSRPFTLADFLVRRAGPSPGSWRLYTFSGNATQVPGSEVLGERLGGQEAAAQALVPQFDALAGLESASSYFSATDIRYLQAVVLAPYPTGLVLGIRFFLAMPGAVDPAKGPQRGFERIPHGYWLRTMPPRPRSFAVAAVRGVPADRMVEALVSPSFSPTREALIDRKDLARLPAFPAPPAELPAKTHWSRPESGRLEVAVDTPAPALVVVAEHFDPGWRATVDGAPAPSVGVDGVAIGVPVPTGRHAVGLSFHPVGFAAGMWVFAATLAAFAGWALVRRTRHVTG